MRKLPPDTKSVMASYKEPLKPVANGYGFIGTLAYDESQQYTQCHLCGYFFKTLGLHTSKVHGVSSKQYKIDFSIPTTLTLTAPKLKSKNYQHWENYTDEQKKEAIRKLAAGRKNRKLPETWRKKSLYQKNLEGRCPDQLLDKIEKLANKLGRTPSRRDFAKEYGTGFSGSVTLTFGGWNEAIKILSLKPNIGGSMLQYGYDKETLLTMLFDFKDRYGRMPMSDDTEKGLLPNRHTYAKYFGTWSKAKEYIKSAGEERL